MSPTGPLELGGSLLASHWRWPAIRVYYVVGGQNWKLEVRLKGAVRTLLRCDVTYPRAQAGSVRPLTAAHDPRASILYCVHPMPSTSR